MFSTLRTRFGIPGVISVMALVFAMFGGAYAANNSSEGDGKATASAKAKKGPRGPKGPAGPAGPAGANGKDGSNGANGSAGGDGKSVTGEPIAAGGACGAGVAGVKYTLGSTSTNVCNGQKGAPGAQGIQGEPWTAGGTLPEGATETGAWSLIVNEGINEETETGNGRTAISFPIPMEEAADTLHTKVVAIDATPPDQCENLDHPGVAGPENPEADSGFLCVYAVNPGTGGVNPNFVFKAGAADLGYSPSGAVIIAFGATAGAYGQGTWAITG